MKKIVSLLALCLVVLLSAHAQIRKIPAEVTDAFKAKFPAAEAVEWKDKLTFFQANFKDNGTPLTVDFSSKGEWQQTEKGLTYDDVPAAVKDGFKKSKYADAGEWKPGETVTMVTKSDKSTLYRVYVDKKGGLQKKYLFFSTSGHLEKETLTL